jgi:D-alanyl-D-alanine carboxypeptidase
MRRPGDSPAGSILTGRGAKTLRLRVAKPRHNTSALLRRGARLGFASILITAIVALPLSEAFAKPRKRASRGNVIAAAIVVDMNSGRVLQAQAADTPRHPASLTKMMTLYMLFTYMRAGAVRYDSELVVTPHAASQSPTKLSVKAGQTVRTADAINALVTLSANDVAVTVAENLAGTEANFARLMTQKAREMGMRSTVFRNASGLPNDGQVTTARDMAILADRLLREFPDYYGCFKTKVFAYKGRKYRNHNRLLFDYRGTDGIKTGYTRAAGFNLVASVRRENKHLVAVVLGGRTGAQRDAAMRSLLTANFPKAATSASEPLVAARQPRPSEPKAVAGSSPKGLFALASIAGLPVRMGKKEDKEPIKTAPPPAPTPLRLTVATPPEPPASPPAKSKPESKAKAKSGPFHVQVGAYGTAQEAEKRLSDVRQKAAKMLAGHAPLTVPFNKDSSQWYRARFAGFSQDRAKSACKELKRLGLDCVVMQAN